MTHYGVIVNSVVTFTRNRTLRGNHYRSGVEAFGRTPVRAVSPALPRTGAASADNPCRSTHSPNLPCYGRSSPPDVPSDHREGSREGWSPDRLIKDVINHCVAPSG